MKSCDVTAFEDVGESGANWDTGKLGHRFYLSYCSVLIIGPCFRLYFSGRPLQNFHTCLFDCISWVVYRLPLILH